MSHMPTRAWNFRDSPTNPSRGISSGTSDRACRFALPPRPIGFGARSWHPARNRPPGRCLPHVEFQCLQQLVLTARFFDGRKPCRPRLLIVIDTVPDEEMPERVTVVIALDPKLRSRRHYRSSTFCSTAASTSAASKRTASFRSRSYLLNGDVPGKIRTGFDEGREPPNTVVAMRRGEHLDRRPPRRLDHQTPHLSMTSSATRCRSRRQAVSPARFV